MELTVVLAGIPVRLSLRSPAYAACFQPFRTEADPVAAVRVPEDALKEAAPHYEAGTTPEQVEYLELGPRVSDTVHIAYIVLKIGRGDGFCDNSGQGGVICRVDEKTGKICSVATDDYFNVYETHPDTGIRFEGYQLPMVQEAVAFARKAALVVPQICHVGWDVAVTPDGPVLIEGNDYPGTDLCQLAPHYPEKQGLWPYYKEILNIK